MNHFDPPTQIFTLQLSSSTEYADPIRDVSLMATFTGPDNRSHTVHGFWDGGTVWRVRLPIAQAGVWRYTTTCSDGNNQGLHGKEDAFDVDSYSGDNPLLQQGPIRVSENRRHLVNGDGTPFFWLADTAWNGVLKAKPLDWSSYLETRREQGFTAIQAVLTQWRAFEADEAGEQAFTGSEAIQINPAFYQRLDDKVAAIMHHGLVPALVLIWGCTPTDPGHYLAADDLIVLARYEVARYGAYRPIWLLGGDGEYRNAHAEKWIKTGRAVFEDASNQLVTMHPRGENWPNEEFRNEPWFSFASYQSGHGDSEQTLRWQTEGPPAQSWQNSPSVPIINQEPNYECHVSYHHRQVIGAPEVRRGLYWSLLIAPTAGVTYGHHGIWPWMEAHGVPMDHPKSGEAPPWWEAVESDGAASVTYLREFFQRIPWWTLQPAQKVLVKQPGNAAPERFIAVATSEEDELLVGYTPVGDAIQINAEIADSYAQAQWYDPSAGQWYDAHSEDDGHFSPPISDGSTERDWLLLLQNGKTG